MEVKSNEMPQEQRKADGGAYMQPQRFEISFYLNDNVVCKRNFKIINFIEGSFNTVEFNNAMDEIVRMIKNDLNSKSRVYSWYIAGPSIKNGEFSKTSPTIMDSNFVLREREYKNEDSEFSTLKEPYYDPDYSRDVLTIVLTDNGKKVYERIIDMSVYPKFVRDRIDLANRQEGVITVNDEQRKIKFEYMDKDKLNIENYILMHMLDGRTDLLKEILFNICTTCSPDKEEGAIYTRNELRKMISGYERVISVGNGKKYPMTVSNERDAMTKSDKEKTLRYVRENAYWMDENMISMLKGICR